LNGKLTDHHNKSFFGHEVGVIVQSPAKNLPHIFLTCIRRKEDGIWEKPSQGEGKTIKLSIEETICILEVLERRLANWRGYHVFHDDKTEIYVGWEDRARNICVFRIGDYEKKFRFPSTRFLTLLLDHIVKEKIEFATSGTFKEKLEEKEEETEDEYRVFSEQIYARDGLHVVETTEYGVSVDLVEIQAKIKVESPKALLIDLENGQEFWIPKSTVHSEYDTQEREQYQLFKVEKWIVEKNLF
jgi:hypothetical protein